MINFGWMNDNTISLLMAQDTLRYCSKIDESKTSIKKFLKNRSIQTNTLLITQRNITPYFATPYFLTLKIWSHFICCDQQYKVNTISYRQCRKSGGGVVSYRPDFLDFKTISFERWDQFTFGRWSDRFNFQK